MLLLTFCRAPVIPGFQGSRGIASPVDRIRAARGSTASGRVDNVLVEDFDHNAVALGKRRLVSFRMH